jgi:hypothetical protein
MLHLTVANEQTRAAFGLRVHTGWAALVAATGPRSSPTLLDRRRIEMIAGHDLFAARGSAEAPPLPAGGSPPPFVYHAAAKLSLAAAERLVRQAADEAGARAREALAAAVAELRARGYHPVKSGVIVANQPFDKPLDQILKAHSLIHAAEGELYRHAIMSASEACGLAVTRVRARELEAPALRKVLTDVGRRAGRPWAQDQKESLLAALVALGG